MEYRYSHLIDPSSYDTQGLCEGIPLRYHRNYDMEEIGIIRLREDWQKFVGPLPSSSSGGSLGPVYNFTAATAPECLPDRLEIVSYVMEFGFLHDDLVDTAKVDEGLVINDKLMEDVNGGIHGGTVGNEKSGESRIMHGIIEEMMAIDPYRTKEFMKYWKSDLGVPRDRTHFKDFDDYLEFRVVDSASYFVTGLATFAMGLTIPPEEKGECLRLTRPVWLAAILTNDVQSWEKEVKSFHTTDKTDMSNGVWILMKQYSIDVEEAKRRVLEIVKAFVAEFVDTVQNIRLREDLSCDSRCFIEAAQYQISGNLLWGSSCPRYHADQTLNELQLSRMRRGAYGPKAAQNASKMTNGNGCKDITANSSSETHTNDKEHSKSIVNDSCRDLDVFLTLDLPRLPDSVVSFPANYISSLPSKNLRDKAVDAMNVWLKVEPNDLSQIKLVVNMLHNASLMLDDVQDGSNSRRGKPATHTVFGLAQTGNSAGYEIVEAISEARKLNDEGCLRIVLDELSKMYLGQGYDVYWTSNIVCPPLEQYLKMVDYKTGGLFHILARLMTVKSKASSASNLIDIATLLGRFFQIRDDYMNLKSADYTKQKGFCEDLDEGKFSLMMIHAMEVACEADKMLLQGLLAQRRISGTMSVAQKQLILDHMERLGSFQYTADVLEGMLDRILAEVKAAEEACATENLPFRSLLNELGVKSHLA
ncbi:geranylgeranyl pyrophosphate synthase [Hypoxylon sp. FL1857]|nr:geranylgeranyl pyrophosphate synthase [Hypoxylon sp. FL1857]